MSEQPPRIEVLKIGYAVPFSVEQLMAGGVITEERARELGWTPPPPLPRRTTLRWALASWWYEHRPHVHFGPCDDGSDYL